MEQYLLALDQGTTSSRCIVFDREGNIRSQVNREFQQFYPQDGWVEQDPTEIWASQMGVVVETMLKMGITASQVAAIGITNQRETVVVWERESGNPICRAIVWQCRRTAEQCAKWKAEGLEPLIHEKTGLLLDPYFSASKLKWILDNVPGARSRAEKGELCFGTVDSWLIYRLTGGKVHATDPSNASRTMLFNIHTMDWDEELLSIFDIPRAMLPQVKPSSGLFGYTDQGLFGGQIPIAGVAGDQQSALFGQCCLNAGDVKNTYGTGGFLLMNTGNTPVSSKQGLLTTVGWRIGNEVSYVLEGSVFTCGAVIQWLRDGMKLFKKASETEKMANKVPDTAGVYLVPAFVGLGAPYWDAYARASIQGLTRAATANHIVRAALEAMAYQTVDVLDAMRQEAPFPIGSIRVDGGAAANNFLLQFQSDVLGIPLTRPSCVETTAKGAASLAALGVGYYSGFEEMKRTWKTDRVFAPTMGAEQRETLLRGWHKAVERSLAWAKVES
ncbi:MAG: glycerol kinase GlpK [Ruminococcaceae bacterium]|nr:glycerol kinase GlpK [Oscillospiraceae bacterium]